MGGKYVSIGGFRCYPVTDGSLLYPKQMLFPEPLMQQEVADALAPEPLRDEILVHYSGLLVDTGKKRILIDTGGGTMGPETGQMPEHIAALGFAPEQIDLVIVSHMHPDHIGGLVTAEGKPRYPNAEVVVSQSEFDFWTSETNQSKMKAKGLFGLGDLELVMQSTIEKNMIALAAAGRVRMTEGAQEEVPGVTTIPAGGHTPGHMGVLVEDKGDQLFFAGDAILHPVHVKYPAWKTAFDVQPEQSALTRLQALDRCATERALTFHFQTTSMSAKARPVCWSPLSH